MMRTKQIIASIGLSLAVSFGVVAGLSASKVAKTAKADLPDDAMCTVLIDMGAAVGFDGFHSPEVHYYDGWDGSIDKWQMMHLVTDTVYAANITYRSSDQTINKFQFLFKQGEEDKWATILDVDPAASTACLFAFNNQWTPNPNEGGRYEWLATQTGDWSSIRFQYYGSGDNNITTFFDADVASKTYKATFEIHEDGFKQSDLGQIFYADWNLASVRTSSVDALLDDYSLNSFEFKGPGKYDIIIHDDYEDEGVFSIHKYEEEYVGIYLVDFSEDAYVYTFGAGMVEEFGAFPGTRLGDIANAKEVSGDLKFQGNEWNIWYLPLNYGYPAADHIIISYLNESQVVGTQTANMLLVEGSAYWFSYDDNYHNDDAGLALQFLLDTEEIRLAAEDKSVCNISSEDAGNIVSAYNKLDENIVSTYIENTTVNTHKRDGSEGTEDVSYKLVVEQIGQLHNLPVNGSSLMPRGYTLSGDNNMIIIVAIASTSLVALTLLLVLKKKKK